MTSYERLISAIEFRTADRIPVFPLVMRFAARFAGMTYRDYMMSGDKLAEAQITCRERFGYDAVTVCSDAYRESDALGAVIDYPEEDAARPVRCALHSKEVLDRLEVPDPLKGHRMRERVEAVRQLKKHYGGKVPSFGWVEAPFSGAAYMRGVEQFLIDLYEDPGFATKAIEFAYETELRFALAQVDAGADMIGAGDAAASLLSPPLYERYALPYAARMFRELKSRGVHIKYHICGDTNHLLRAMARLGADIINLDFMVDLKAAREAFGPSTAIKGNVNPVMVESLSPSELISRLQECAGQAGRLGYIISPGCEVTPDTPYENMDAMIETAFKIQY
ncbi:MAG: hypothetical protein HPY71_09415 [Firmicutes bacterium]|nr:hypothetical protein [Bacillota bacterium]